MIDERIAERRAAVRDDQRRWRLRRTLWLVGLLVVLAAVVAVERSALVGLEEVTVGGVERLDPDTVREAAALELGTSTLRLPLRAAAERVRALPLVAAVEAGRVDPLTVHLEVEEREPVLTVRGEDIARYLDRAGVIIDEVGEDEDSSAVGPEIVLGSEPPAVGERADAAPALGNAHTTWQGLSGPLRAEVIRYRADGPDELTLELRNGIQVRFGRAERIDEKVRALGAVLEDVGTTPVEMIDVRAPSAPVVVAPG